MTDENIMQDADAPEVPAEQQVVQSRREFLIGLGKWSAAVVTGVVLGAGALVTEREAEAASWINSRGGWINGGGGWVNRGGGGWINGGGGWVNRYGGGGGGWINGGGGGGWVNRRGGGGGSWVNRR